MADTFGFGTQVHNPAYQGTVVCVVAMSTCKGLLVQLQNTTQQLLQVRLHIYTALLFWVKNSLRRDLRACNCKTFPRVACVLLRMHSS